MRVAWRLTWDDGAVEVVRPGDAILDVEKLRQDKRLLLKCEPIKEEA